MRQSEVKTIALGVGAAVIYETSNREDIQLPRLTILMPWCPGYGDDFPVPAHSMTLRTGEVKALYDALHAYYTGKGTP